MNEDGYRTSSELNEGNVGKHKIKDLGVESCMGGIIEKWDIGNNKIETDMITTRENVELRHELGVSYENAQKGKRLNARRAL